jgi:hypothetical protein
LEKADEIRFYRMKSPIQRRFTELLSLLVIS